VDGAGNALVTLWTESELFPTHNALWPTPPIAEEMSVLFKLDSNGAVLYSTYLPLDTFGTRHNLAVDAEGHAYVTGSSHVVTASGPIYRSQMRLLKLSPDGSQLLLDVYIGYEAEEKGIAIALDAAGAIYLTGTTEGIGLFPTTPNAHQPVCGDVFYDPNTYCFRDGIVVVLDPSGQMIYGSYHGGSFSDDPQAIATDGNGHILIAGNTLSGQFPTVKALQDSCPINPDTETCRLSRGFVSVLELTGGAATLTYSTYLGSTEEESTSVVRGATMDSTGHSYITGDTNGRHFPLMNPVQPLLSESFCAGERLCYDAFVVTLTPSGTLHFGTYFGATFDEFSFDLAVRENSIYLTGIPEENNFPTTGTALQPDDLPVTDAFLVTLGEAGAPPPP
jgi:hypothetical protein